MAQLKILIGGDDAKIYYSYVEPKLFLQLTGKKVPEPCIFVVEVKKENLNTATQLAKEFWGKRFELVDDFNLEVLRTLIDL